jgi:hypothetical protein
VIWSRQSSSGEGATTDALSTPGSSSGLVASPTPVSCLQYSHSIPWYQPVNGRPVHPNSFAYVASIQAAPDFDPKVLHAGFGASDGDEHYGTTYNVVNGTPAETVPLQFDSSEDAQASDPGPYNIPADAVALDSYVIAVDNATCRSSEAYGSPETRPWEQAIQAGIFDLNTFQSRPGGAASAIQSGLPLFPMLVRYDEVNGSAEIRHALLFNAPVKSSRFVAPATRGVGGGTDDADLPPLGSRFRLRADYPCAQLSTSPGQKICRALQDYGMFLGGSSGSLFDLQGAADERWDNDALHDDMKQLTPGDFQVVT